MAKHRKKSNHKQLLSIPIAGFILLATPANANAEPDWDKLAQCESGGNWSINTGNGYYGGIQFHPRTWNAYKPTGAPSSAHLASRAQQIEAGRKVLAAQGPGAWPSCSAKTGWHKGGGTPVVEVAQQPQKSTGAIRVHTVKQGETLAGITPQWRQVKTRSGNPAIIYPGEQLQIPV